MTKGEGGGFTRFLHTNCPRPRIHKVMIPPSSCSLCSMPVSGPYGTYCSLSYNHSGFAHNCHQSTGWSTAKPTIAVTLNFKQVAQN